MRFKISSAFLLYIMYHPMIVKIKTIAWSWKPLNDNILFDIHIEFC